MEFLKNQQVSDSLSACTEFYSKAACKINGVFYTPQFLAQYLAKKVIHYCDKNKNLRSIIDPACGDSILLRSFVEEISHKKNRDCTLEIFGIDKDTNAVKNSCAKFVNSYSDIKAKFINADALFPGSGQNTFDSWKMLRQKIKCQKGFDIALSNPPWGAELSDYNISILNKNFILAKGQFDIYDLFIEIILNNLSENGIYGLILPDSIFNYEQTGLRKLLTKDTTIHLIARLGEKIFGEINRACVVIIGRKRKPPANHQIDCFRLSANFKKRILSNELELEQAELMLSHKIPQSRFLNNNKCAFDIDLKIDEQKTLDKIQNTDVLFRDVVNNTRGAEISKKGLACKCSNCECWMPYPKTTHPKCFHCKTTINIDSVLTERIVLNHNGKGNFKLKVGEDLFRYTSTSKSWINTLKKGINYKNLKIYRGKKILVRKTGVGITASLDYENSITNQVVYILKLKPEFNSKLTLEFVLSVLNSRAMTFYLIKKYGENEWKSHPYLTQSMLVNLPFPKIDFTSKLHERLIIKVTEIIKSEIVGSKDKNISKSNDLVIEKIIAHFFDLTKKDYKLIFKTLKSAEQLIPIKRLLDCSYHDIFEVASI